MLSFSQPARSRDKRVRRITRVTDIIQSHSIDIVLLWLIQHGALLLFAWSCEERLTLHATLVVCIGRNYKFNFQDGHDELATPSRCRGACYVTPILARALLYLVVLFFSDSDICHSAH